jgi:type III pantothenate kinase
VIWAILVGNTRTVAALMRGDAVFRKHAIPTDALRSRKGRSAWAGRLRRLSSAEGMILASVVPALDRPLVSVLEKSFGVRPECVTPQSRLGIRVRVRRPSQVGADRLANAVAARDLYGAPVVVVDFGTGTTFDVVDPKGDYVGGAILPGLGISLRALHDYTAKIPLVSFAKSRRAVGRSTEEAVRSGVYHGAVGAVRELLRRIRGELGRPSPAVATGGWCGVFRGDRSFRYIEPDLTLMGLSRIWETRRNGKGTSPDGPCGKPPSRRGKDGRRTDSYGKRMGKPHAAA